MNIFLTFYRRPNGPEQMLIHYGETLTAAIEAFEHTAVQQGLIITNVVRVPDGALAPAATETKNAED